MSLVWILIWGGKMFESTDQNLFHIFRFQGRSKVYLECQNPIFQFNLNIFTLLRRTIQKKRGDERCTLKSHSLTETQKGAGRGWGMGQTEVSAKNAPWYQEEPRTIAQTPQTSALGHRIQDKASRAQVLGLGMQEPQFPTL